MARDPETDQQARVIRPRAELLPEAAQAFRFIGGKNGGITSFLKPETTALEPSQNVFWRP